ncbi:uncharacterized protein LOC121945487 [Plectropomus leopardus]|uniref:uncharacterized protein LOC121945487 n=1 Tax=Plectropomus leopardus TaxID=160734 RepID=UPI001C4D9D84|nr:uncharacterized protein LOC121945487 [Plectropomus leopardus]
MAETCFVLGCNAAKGELVSVHVLPKDLQIREKWVQFIWKNRSVPDKLPEKTRICSSHFPEHCFENFTQKQMGFATKLVLKPDAVPSIYPGDTASTSQYGGQPGISGSFCQTLPAVRHVACQTDPPETKSVRPVRSVGTQLSMKTLQNHFRSTATQAKIPSRDCGVCTLTFPLDSPLLFLQPTIVKRPSKRPRLSLTDEEEGP